MSGVENPCRAMTWAWYGFDPLDAIADSRLATRQPFITGAASVNPVSASWTRRAWASSGAVSGRPLSSGTSSGSTGRR